MERLRALRKERKETQQVIADILGVDRTTYAKYELGTFEPNIASLRLLSEHFDVSIDYLLENTQTRKEIVPLQSVGLVGDVEIDKLDTEQRALLEEFARYLLSKSDG